MSARTPARTSNIFDLYEKANILISTDETTEESVNEIIKQFEEHPPEVHAFLRPSLNKVLWERCHLPEIFLNPPLTGFSEDGSELIGEGSFGRVYRAKYQGKDVAVKVLRQGTGTASDDVNVFFQEVQSWKKISRSHYIAPFYGCSVRVNRNPRLVFTLVSLLADNSLLRHVMDENPHCVTCKLIIDVAKGLRDLHEIGYIHGDLSLDNVLVFDKDAKLADFGLIKLTNTVSQFSLSGKLEDLHPGRVSPELFKGIGRSLKSDIFSYGRLVYEMFNPVHEMFRYRKFIECPPKPERMMDDSWDGLWELLSKCWETEPDDRPTANDIVSQLESIFNKMVENNNVSTKPGTNMDNGNSNSNSHSQNANQGGQDRGQASDGDNETGHKPSAITSGSNGSHQDQNHLPQLTPTNSSLISGILQPQPQALPIPNPIPAPASPVVTIIPAAVPTFIPTATTNEGDRDRGQVSDENVETGDKPSAVNNSSTSGGNHQNQSHLPPINLSLINGIPQPQPQTLLISNPIPAPTSPAAAVPALISTATPNLDTNGRDQDQGQAGNGDTETEDKLSAVTSSSISGSNHQDQNHLPQLTLINPSLINNIPQPQPQALPAIPAPALAAVISAAAPTGTSISTAIPDLIPAPTPTFEKDGYDPHNHNNNHEQEPEYGPHKCSERKSRMNIYDVGIMISTFIPIISSIIYFYCLRPT